MTEELDHVERFCPPWRPSTLTECGRPSEGRTVLTYDEIKAKFKREGQRRAAMTTCMTCLAVSRRYPWHRKPSSVYAREISRAETERQPVDGPIGAYGERNTSIDTELRAIATLIERHREEWDVLISTPDELAGRRHKRS